MKAFNLSCIFIATKGLQLLSDNWGGDDGEEFLSSIWNYDSDMNDEIS